MTDPADVQLPLAPARTPRSPPSISYAQILEQAATAIEAAALQKGADGAESLRLTVDFPPERSETRAGTLVSRFENNLNFLQQLGARLSAQGAAPACLERVGPVVEIRDNVNPQGGGEYLTDDECMVGVRIAKGDARTARTTTLLLNAGVDAATLRQVRALDDDADGVVVLLNCGLERVSWFAKLGFAAYIDSFDAAYYLRAVAAGGWLFRRGGDAWMVVAGAADGARVVSTSARRPTLFEAEQQIRAAVAGEAGAP